MQYINVTSAFKSWQGLNGTHSVLCDWCGCTENATFSCVFFKRSYLFNMSDDLFDVTTVPAGANGVKWIEPPIITPTATRFSVTRVFSWVKFSFPLLSQICKSVYWLSGSKLGWGDWSTLSISSTVFLFISLFLFFSAPNFAIMANACKAAFSWWTALNWGRNEQLANEHSGVFWQFKSHVFPPRVVKHQKKSYTELMIIFMCDSLSTYGCSLSKIWCYNKTGIVI